MSETTAEEAKQRGSASLLKRLVRLRKERGLSQSKLAEKAGLTPAAISKIESNHNIDPAFSTVLALSNALDVPIDVLAGLRPYPESEEWIRIENARLKNTIYEMRALVNQAI